MAEDTFAQVSGRVLLRAPDVGAPLARDFVVDAFRQLAERRQWSWRLKTGQFLIPAVYSTGTAVVTRNSITVTGTSTVWDSSMIGRQFRVGTGAPIYTIVSVESSTSLTLDAPYGGATASGLSYQIYQAYVTVPDDFNYFVSVIDPNNNWSLWKNISQAEVDNVDAQRSNTGTPYCVVSHDYTQAATGTVGSVVQAIGTGASPVSSGTYTAPNSAIYTVECTLGGATGTATFRWKKNEGTYTSGVVTSSSFQELSDGVGIYWPTGQTYIDDAIWVIATTPGSAPGLPRYELWPHQQAEYVYQYLYCSVLPDLNEAGAVIPRYVRGDILKEMAMASAARWPGASDDKPNTYFNLQLAIMHETRAERMIMELEKNDDDIYAQDLMARFSSFPMAPYPFGDSAWLQRHAI